MTNSPSKMIVNAPDVSKTSESSSPMDFGSKLAKFRVEARLSQGALAKQCFVSHQTVSKWENGLAFPELSKLPMLCTAFSVTPHQMLSPAEAPAPDKKIAVEMISPLEMGLHIRRLRQESGLSQEEFGERLNVSRQSVSRWENGQMLPETDTFLLMIRTFSVSADSFFSITLLEEAEAPETQEMQGMLEVSEIPEAFPALKEENHLRKARCLLKGTLFLGLILLVWSIIALLARLI